MKLGAVLLAVNDNPHYLQFWPAVRDCWLKIVKVPVFLAYVGETLPDSLKGDPYVTHFKWPTFKTEWPSATVAQCIRLLLPALLPVDGAVLIGDIDCAPLNPEFFHAEVAKARDDQFVSLRGILEADKQVCMMYVAAHPKTWSEMFDIRHINDVYLALQGFARNYPADGKHGGKGWCSDQIELYRMVKAWQATKPNRIRINDWSWDIPRLCRSMPAEWVNGLSEPLKARIFHGHYIDFHMPPLAGNEKTVLEILNFALQANELKRQQRALTHLAAE